MKRGVSNAVVLLFILAILSVLIFRDSFTGGDSFSGGITGAASSQISNLTATVQTFIACTWSNDALNVAFGITLNPGSTGYNGTLNYNATLGNGTVTNGTKYNATLDTLSNVNVNITINGSNLTSGANRIGIQNVSWASNYTAFVNASNTTQMTYANATRINETTNAYPVAVNLSSGATAHFRFFLDIPSGQVAASYTGNYTMLCSQTT